MKPLKDNKMQEFIILLLLLLLHSIIFVSISGKKQSLKMIICYCWDSKWNNMLVCGWQAINYILVRKPIFIEFY